MFKDEKISSKNIKQAVAIPEKTFKVNLGLACNNNCQFCYHKNARRNKNKDQNLKFEEAIQLISILKDGGVEGILFSGGEPTLRTDLSRIVTHARQIGIKHIGIETNGVRLSDLKIILALKDAGVDEFRFSVLGHNAAIHDMHTQSIGSFLHLVEAIKYSRQLGIETKANTVVTGLNYNFLLPLMEEMLKLHISTINLICFNPIAETSVRQDSMNILYSFVAPKLQQVADQYWNVFENLRFSSIPFCMMAGYEQFVRNGTQTAQFLEESHDLVENSIQSSLLNQRIKNKLHPFLRNFYQKTFRAEWQQKRREDVLKLFNLKYKVKSPDCGKCRYDFICDGVWRNYVKWIGFREIKPAPGEKITDPSYFMR